jgi:hypothetical protein
LPGSAKAMEPTRCFAECLQTPNATLSCCNTIDSPLRSRMISPSALKSAPVAPNMYGIKR